jgi:rRNA maturation endonuclease Nob1
MNSAAIVVMDQPEVNSVNPPLYPHFAQRRAHREYETIRRAIIRCYRCGNVARGPKVHKSHHCPACGAEVRP